MIDRAELREWLDGRRFIHVPASIVARAYLATPTPDQLERWAQYLEVADGNLDYLYDVKEMRAFAAKMREAEK